MRMTGIEGYGVYIPKYRVKVEDIAKTWGKYARGEKSVPHHDEDALSMAIEASENALRHSNITPSNISAIFVASISSFAVKSLSAFLATALNVPEDALIVDCGRSERAGSTILRLAIDFIESEKTNYALIVATDALKARPGEELEYTSAAGAVAMVIGKDTNVIAEFDGYCSLTPRAEIIERWRGESELYLRGDYDIAFARKFGYGFYVSNCVRKMLNKLGRKITDYNYVALQQPDARRVLDIVRELKLTPDQVNPGNIVQFIGDVGCASMLMSLAAILDIAKPGEKILAASYGSGAGSDAFSLTVKDSIKDKRHRLKPVKAFIESKEYIDYATYLHYSGIIKTPW